MPWQVANRDITIPGESPQYRNLYREDISETCHVCLVEVEKLPKPVISCAMPALLEMTIKTYTLVAKKAREDMMEFLLVNHLLGFPIFDPGGECDHQDQLMAFGSEIKRSFAGKASKHVGACGKCARSLVALITRHFEDFRDHSLYKGHQVFLYKRAHIFASNLWSAFKGQGHGELCGMGLITIFAYYIVLAVLRELGVLQNSLALAGTIDANDEINSGREEEVEKTKDLIKAKFRKQGSSVEFLVQVREYTKKKKRTFWSPLHHGRGEEYFSLTYQREQLQADSKNIITEYIVGLILLGRPITKVYFELYGYTSMTQDIFFLSDFKLGHYTKTLPRSMFLVKFIGTIVVGTIILGTVVVELHRSHMP
ncbi:UPF0553-like protein [Cinnamomum micranthum f. kanehirae]|uniref:Queuosine 5'-phosphate N-glycosylase/hydrolase n=1 Tax=Cinnamomum micranthum f. kanehirae TaxID=337451 RepID=A0A443P680_9MAGN|nr:UPF0553-like protein [Cinnamomum micranthum f. kanehirae]